MAKQVNKARVLRNSTGETVSFTDAVVLSLNATKQGTKAQSAMIVGLYNYEPTITVDACKNYFRSEAGEKRVELQNAFLAKCPKFSTLLERAGKVKTELAAAKKAGNVTRVAELDAEQRNDINKPLNSARSMFHRSMQALYCVRGTMIALGVTLSKHSDIIIATMVEEEKDGKKTQERKEIAYKATALQKTGTDALKSAALIKTSERATRTPGTTVVKDGKPTGVAAISITAKGIADVLANNSDDDAVQKTVKNKADVALSMAQMARVFTFAEAHQTEIRATLSNVVVTLMKALGAKTLAEAEKHLAKDDDNKAKANGNGVKQEAKAA